MTRSQFVLFFSVDFVPSSLVGIKEYSNILFPLIGYAGKLFSRIRNQTAKLTDQRIRCMNEFTTGIRVIKLYGWENSFSKIIETYRRLFKKFIAQFFKEH